LTGCAGVNGSAHFGQLRTWIGAKRTCGSLLYCKSCAVIAETWTFVPSMHSPLRTALCARGFLPSATPRRVRADDARPALPPARVSARSLLTSLPAFIPVDQRDKCLDAGMLPVLLDTASKEQDIKALRQLTWLMLNVTRFKPRRRETLVSEAGRTSRWGE
jgi:hypothetical protein